MSKITRWFWLWGLLSFVVFPLWALEVGSPLPRFRVTAHDGKALTHEELLGKISVLFYDTRQTAPANEAFKYEIKAFREKHLPLLENLQVIQVIDASSANSLTRTVWKRKLRENEQKHGITLYADWSGKMRRDLGFKPQVSNLLVIDPQGMVRYALSGEFSEEERSRLLSLLLTIGKETQR